MNPSFDGETSAGFEVFANVEQLDQANREGGWDLEHRQLSPGAFRAVFRMRRGQRMLFMRERYQADLEIRGKPPDNSRAVMIPWKLSKRADLNRQELYEGILCTLGPEAELDALIVDELAVDSFYFPEKLFRQTLVQLAPGQAPEFADRSEAVSLAAQELVSVRHLFSAGLESTTGGAVWREELEAALIQQVAEACLRQFSTAGSDRKHRRPSVGKQFDLAREYIECNLRAPIKMADLCAHAGIGLRSLQRLFLRQAHVTPTQYILARRLNSVRRQLIAGDPEAGRVTRSALDHGFGHMGRFAVQYRTFFGESPSRTSQAAADR